MSNKDKNSNLSEDEQVLDGEFVEQELGDALEDTLIEEGEAPTMESLLQDLAAMRETNNVLDDKYIRAKAETDNARRISVKEVEKARKFALENFAKELLQVKDSLDQAAQVDLSNNVTAELVGQMSEGLDLTRKQLDSVFERFNVEEVVPEAGDPLDPELHQAMTRQPSQDVDANKIVSTIQTGYTLNGRLLRPAMVIVSSGS
jgi:molecular chaperone GrpE